MSAEPNANAPRSADPALPPTTDSNKEKTGLNTSAGPEMPGSAPRDKNLSLSSLPIDLRPKSLLSTADATLTRLNAVLKQPTGLAAFLSTTNYALYILTHAHLTSPTRAQVINTLRTTFGLPASKIPPAALKPAAPTSPLLPLALTLADLRTTLRLTGLIPLYIALKSLIKTRNQAKDKVTYAIQLAQVLSYMTFQFIENVYHLTNKTVINSNWTNTRFARLGGLEKLVTWSCRAWCSGITFEFLRLARQTQLANQPGSDYSKMDANAKKEADKKFWTDLFVATSWYPMAWHYSVEGGIGLNLGMVGCCGFFANVGNFLRLWQETQG